MAAPAARKVSKMTKQNPQAIIGEAIILLNNKIKTPDQMRRLQKLAHELAEALREKEVSK